MTSKLTKKITRYHDGNIESVFFVDECGLKQGEFKSFFRVTRVVYEHSFYKDDVRHGEHKRYFIHSICHNIYEKGVIRTLSEDEKFELNNISSHEEVLSLTLKYGVPLLASLAIKS